MIRRNTCAYLFNRYVFPMFSSSFPSSQVSLAQKVEKHELLEFRRIAAYVYKKNKRWEQSIRLSKDDKMYKDAIDTAAASGDRKLAEELLGFFVEARDKACFAGTLYTCYTLIRPDVAVELAWRNGYVDYVMPYMIQFLRHSYEKLQELDERTRPKKSDGEEDASAAAAAAAMGGMGMMEPTGPLLSKFHLWRRWYSHDT